MIIRDYRKLRLATFSLVLFVLSVVAWTLLTLFESRLVGVSLTVERTITLLGLILPAGIGAVLSIMSLIRQEGRAWLAILGLLLNAFFAFFHLAVVLFAG